MLVACSKQSDDVQKRVAPEKNTFFSKVKHYKDQRQPGTDTVWTLHLFTDGLKADFARFDGHTYQETSTFIEVGVIWTK